MAKTKFYYEYDLFLPVTGPAKTLDPVLKETRAELLDYFGGLTETRQSNKGIWKIGPATVKDTIQIWHVLSDKGAAGDRFMAALRKKLQRRLKEDLILIIRHKVDQI